MPTLDIEKIRNYFSGQPILRAWLFGSYARGEQTEDSDVDILVTLDENVGLFKYASMWNDLKELLSKDVDLVGDTSLLPWVKDDVENEKKLIYERKTS